MAQLVIVSGASAQRLHDLELPGIHFALLFVPIYSIYLMFVFLIRRGNRGSNLYGEDPIAANKSEE